MIILLNMNTYMNLTKKILNQSEKILQLDHYSTLKMLIVENRILQILSA